jgi:hypothetical protein
MSAARVAWYGEYGCISSAGVLWARRACCRGDSRISEWIFLSITGGYLKCYYVRQCGSYEYTTFKIYYTWVTVAIEYTCV